MFWALEEAPRFLLERSQLEQLCREVTWVSRLSWGLTPNLDLKVDVDLAVEGETFEGELVYPKLFPDTPGYVRPRSPTERWSMHQYGSGGPLCLEWGPDNWHRDISGAELLRSTMRLLQGERSPDPAARAVPSRHRVTLGQEVRAKNRRLVITPALVEHIQGLAKPSLSAIGAQLLFHEGTLVAFANAIASTDSGSFHPPDLPRGVTEHVPLYSFAAEGTLFKGAGVGGLRGFETAGALLDAIRSAGFPDYRWPEKSPEKCKSTGHLVLLVDVLSDGSEVMRAFSVDIHGDGVVTEMALLASDQTQRLPPEHAQLSEKKLGIVGLGSVGSKASVSLARSGFRKFLLVDDDVLLPSNMTRHELSWAHVGMNKVDAVKEALELITPGLDVQVRPARIAGQESAQFASTALDALAGCDILVDATSNARVFVQLAAMARRHKKPLVWGEVFAGGIGALLMRSRPGQDPEPLNMRSGVHRFLDKLPTAPFAIATKYDVQESEDAPLIVFDGEVTEFTASLVRFVIDSALDRSPPEFPHSAYLLGFKRAWVFGQPFETYPIQITMPEGSLPEEANKGAENEAAAIIVSMLKQGADANSSSSS